MTSVRTVLVDGARLLTDSGTAQVLSVDASGVGLRYSWGDASIISWADLGTLRSIENGIAEALSQPMQPVWDGLDEAIRSAALTRLEIVQEILTGYRDGHPAFAREGEPRSPFGPGFGVSEHKRCIEMAKQLNLEAKFDRDLQRRVADGDLKSGGVSDQTIRRWVREFKRDGLLALIDGRTVRPSKSFDRIDQHYRDAAIKVLDSLDGDRSTISIEEIKRQTEVDLKISGLAHIKPPERITRQYLSNLKRERGESTRAQLSRRLRHVSGTKHYPAIRPGQVVAIDATRADNLVYDPYTGKPYSVEILTAIDVATRVVLAIRVVARSANGIEAGLLVYDICRPFSMMVDGTSIGHWRWVGLPEQLDFSQVPVRAGQRLFAPDFSTLQGEHGIPSVLPDAIHLRVQAFPGTARPHGHRPAAQSRRQGQRQPARRTLARNRPAGTAADTGIQGPQHLRAGALGQQGADADRHRTRATPSPFHRAGLSPQRPHRNHPAGKGRRTGVPVGDVGRDGLDDRAHRRTPAARPDLPIPPRPLGNHQP
jgi:putative transposase